MNRTWMEKDGNQSQNAGNSSREEGQMARNNMEWLSVPKNSSKTHMSDVLKRASGRPDYRRKDEFIKYYRSIQNGHTEYSRQKDSALFFILHQFPYISWYIWGVTLLILLISVIGLASPVVSFSLNIGSIETRILVSALMPYVSLLAVLESFRSRRYGTFELESACLFSFKGIYFGRVACIGSVHLLLIIFLTFLLGKDAGWNGYTMTAVMLTIPYLFTATVNTIICRTQPGRKNSFACSGTALIISIVTLEVLHKPVWVMMLKTEVWIGIMILLAAIYLYEIRKTWNQEALAWN